MRFFPVTQLQLTQETTAALGKDNTAVRQVHKKISGMRSSIRNQEAVLCIRSTTEAQG